MLPEIYNRNLLEEIENNGSSETGINRDLDTFLISYP